MKMKVKIFVWQISVCILATCWQGCSTIQQHMDPAIGTPQFIYAGTQADIGMISGDMWEAPEVGIVMGLFDLPFSIAYDTVVLPFDLWMVTVSGKPRTRPKLPPNETPAEPDLSTP
jgi:uncharacterized protein YceK